MTVLDAIGLMVYMVTMTLGDFHLVRGMNLRSSLTLGLNPTDHLKTPTSVIVNKSRYGTTPLPEQDEEGHRRHLEVIVPLRPGW